ncbi:MAG TPA: aldehyde dehydrogenase family protein [Candidatus Acidoferrum sp.]|nr:aldehyde dehydrogenase family protein [Candidatus Acidoferrum sp.]
MATATAQALSPAAREFVENGPRRLVIGAEQVEAADGRTFETIDPATGDVICEVALAGPEDVERAAQAARAALEGPLRKVNAAKRSSLMYSLAELIKANGDELAELESLDNGKPLAAAKGDMAAAVNHLRYYAGWPTKIEGETIPVSARDVLCYTLREPVGVCALIVPWNFPLLMAVWKVAPALAAGCPAILKPAEQTPLTALRLGELALGAGFPEGTLNVLTGDGTTGAALVDSPGVHKVAFTGSTEVGREIGAKCGRSLKRVTLELGGKSPNIILPDADLDAAIKGSYQGIYFNSGQACNAGSRLFVQRELFDEVIERLAGYAREAKLGPGLDPETELGPLVSEEQLARVKGYIDSGVREGAELAAGGSPDGGDGTSGDGGLPSGGYFVPPTLFTGVEDSMRIAREEIFGPVLVAMPFEDLEEVARRANDTEYGLAAGLWTRDISNAHKLAAMLQAGNVYINTWGGGDPAAPFGGYKASGIGREKGHANLDAYLETKTVFVQL